MSEKYRIETGKWLELTATVNKLIDEGWRPLGSAFTTGEMYGEWIEGQGRWGEVAVFGQAMIREDSHA